MAKKKKAMPKKSGGKGPKFGSAAWKAKYGKGKSKK